MRYISLDIETTGLEPTCDQILQIAMVVENTGINPLPEVENLPYINFFISRSRYEGSAYALAMNSWILDILSGKVTTKIPIFTDDAWERYIARFLEEQGFTLSSHKIPLAGKNVGSFDFQFLPRDVQKHFHYRFIDPGSKFVDFKSDDVVPSTDALMKRLDVSGAVTHDALQDARDVIRILRKSY